MQLFLVKICIYNFCVIELTRYLHSAPFVCLHIGMYMIELLGYSQI